MITISASFRRLAFPRLAFPSFAFPSFAFRRFACRCPDTARRARSVKAQCVTVTIEARVPGFPGYVLIDTSLATGSAVVWNPALGRYVSGAVQRGELLRITGASGDSLELVQSTGTCPTLNLPISGTRYCNVSICVSRDGRARQITLRVSSPSNAGRIHTSQKSAPIVGARQS
jgi:hypothetical protein